jgi:hypothetical protein
MPRRPFCANSGGGGSRCCRSAHARRAPEQLVLRVAIGEAARVIRGLPIRAAHDDELQRALHVPAGFHELHGQPVEQFRVRGKGALHPEVAHRPHQPFAEKLESLAKKCDEIGLKSQAVITRGWRIPRFPNRQYLFLPEAKDSLAPKMGAADAGFAPMGDAPGTYVLQA